MSCRSQRSSLIRKKFEFYFEKEIELSLSPENANNLSEELEMLENDVYEFSEKINQYQSETNETTQ